VGCGGVAGKGGEPARDLKGAEVSTSCCNSVRLKLQSFRTRLYNRTQHLRGYLFETTGLVEGRESGVGLKN